MPIVAVVGAVVAGAIAAPAVGALIGGAALSVTGALEITAAVGATMSAVGAVTRDKGLTTAGAVIGGIGAVGSLASAAGLIDGSTTLFGDAAANAGQTATASAVATSDTAGLPAGAMSPEGFPDVTDSMSGVAPLPPSDAMAATAAPTATPTDANATPPPVMPSGVPSDTPPVSPAAPGGTSAGLINAPAPSMTIANTEPGVAPANQFQTITGVNMPPPASLSPSNIAGAASGTNLGAGVPEQPGYLGGIIDFAKSNQLVSYGAIQAGGALISGMFNPVTPAQVAALDAQAANNRAAAALTSTQTSNIQSGVPVAKPVSAPNVTGKPAGLINSAITPPVTGAPTPTNMAA